MLLNSNLLSKSLFEFESKYADSLSRLTIHGFVAWPLVKTPVYFRLLAEQAGGQQKNNQAGISIFKKAGLQFLKIGRMARLLLLITRFKLFHQRVQVLFYTYAADRPVKNEKGKYHNWLVDPFITEKIVQHYFYMEQPLKGAVREPAQIRPHMSVGLLSSLASVHRKKFTGSEEVKQVAAQLYALLTEHFNNSGIKAELSLAGIESDIYGFLGDYYAYRYFLKKLSPRFIITSERPGTGILAAASSLGIPAMDLQHGVIDKHHPQYIYSAQLQGFKENMAMPSYLGVLGELHRNILLQQGFWRPDEVIVLGNSRVEKNRAKFKPGAANPNPSKKQVLIPTQWNIAGEMKQLLQNLVRHVQDDIEIVLKLHPLEPAANVEQFRQMAIAHAGKISIAEKDSDIYSLIDRSLLMIGFDSAALLEAIALSKPCITITTPGMPQGMHSMFNDKNLEEAIKAVDLDNVECITGLIDKASHDPVFYEEWVNAARGQGLYLYANNYIGNCRAFIEKFITHKAAHS